MTLTYKFGHDDYDYDYDADDQEVQEYVFKQLCKNTKFEGDEQQLIYLMYDLDLVPDNFRNFEDELKRYFYQDAKKEYEESYESYAEHKSNTYWRH